MFPATSSAVDSTIGRSTATREATTNLLQSFVQVLDWLEDELELGEYRREFARAKVDGALLLNLEVSDVCRNNA